MSETPNNPKGAAGLTPRGLAPACVPRVYVCGRASGPARIDGDLEKAFWRGAAWTEAFTDIEGARGRTPRHETRAKMAWDDECLYIGAWMEEPHVWATLTERDSVIFQDNDFEVFLNPSCDGRDYYELEVNALNTVWDLFLRRPYRAGGKGDNAWDCAGLRTAVRVAGTLNDPSDEDRGWSVEIAMPWRAFDRHAGAAGITGPGEPPRAGEVWLVNFSRVEWDHRVVERGGRRVYEKVAGAGEHNWVWSPMGLVDMHVPWRWGIVAFEGEGRGGCGRV